MKKFKTLSVVLAGLIASASIIYSSPVNAEVVYDSSEGFTYSCYDVNKDNSVDVFDLCMMKRFLLNQSSEEDLSLAFENQDTINSMLYACREYVSQASEDWYARIVDINIDTNVYSGRVEPYAAIATITFDKAFDEDALRYLCTNLSGSVVVDALNNKCKTLRLVVDGGHVQAATPYSGTELTSIVKTEEVTPITGALYSYFSDASAEWYAIINSIDIRSYYQDDDSAIATVTFDRAFDEEALGRLCTNIDEPEALFAVANKYNTLRVVVKYGHVESVVPASSAEYSCNTTLVTPSELEYAVTDFLQSNSTEWYAKVNSVSIEAIADGSSSSSVDSNSGIATVTFDRPLTEDAAARLIYGVDDIESEVNFALENSVTTLKLVIKYGHVQTSVPVK